MNVQSIVRRAWPALVLATLALVYALLLLPLMPNPRHGIGSDYAYFIPELLAGYFWFLRNGIFAIPWFTPAQCGGLPFFPDPQSGFYTLPQFLTFVMPPLQALRTTFLAFAVLGGAGSYWLARGSFRASQPAAALAAALFMFNGFYASRMLVGHLTFHPFMLLPALVAAVLPGAGAGAAAVSRAGWTLRIGVAVLCLAYMVQGGMAHVLPPAMLSAAVILLMDAAVNGWRRAPWLALAAATALGLCVSAVNLVAWSAFLSQFPRNQYPLPGIPGLLATLWLVIRVLFFAVPDDAPAAIANSAWLEARHEWEYGITAVPLLLIVAGLAQTLRARGFPPSGAPRRLALAACLVLLAVPVALNVYQPDWNALLKSAPFLGSSSNLLRWFSAYILPAIVAAALALDLLAEGRARAVLAGGGIAAMLAINLTADRAEYYGAAGQGTYDPQLVEQAYADAAASGRVLPVTAIAVTLNAKGEIQLGGAGNDALTKGYSQLACYQPIFGYRLENYPVMQLRPGPALRVSGDVLNVKNPACYVFPAENHCTPGEQFSVLQRVQASAFLAYEAVDFVAPPRLWAAVWISRISFAATLAAIAIALAVLLLRRREQGVA